jgi:hypothetical protein
LISDVVVSDGVYIVLDAPRAPETKHLFVTADYEYTPPDDDGMRDGYQLYIDQEVRGRYSPDNSYYRIDWLDVNNFEEQGDDMEILYRQDKPHPNYLTWLNYTWGYDMVTHFRSDDMVRTELDAKAPYGYAGNLTLLHGVTYYGFVEATNCCGMKARAMSDPLTIDLTPPVLGDIDVKWFEEEKIIQFHFNDYYDLESTVVEYEYKLKTYWGEWVIDTTTAGKNNYLNETACVLNQHELEECYGSAPSVNPTAMPSRTPTTSPTLGPTDSPTTFAPSVSPTISPSMTPTYSPTSSPTQAPTPAGETWSPSVTPTTTPTVSPTTQNPTTSQPTVGPSLTPTTSPSVTPTVQPTLGVTDGLVVGVKDGPTVGWLVVGF